MFINKLCIFSIRFLYARRLKGEFDFLILAPVLNIGIKA